VPPTAPVTKSVDPPAEIDYHLTEAARRKDLMIGGGLVVLTTGNPVVAVVAVIIGLLGLAPRSQGQSLDYYIEGNNNQRVFPWDVGRVGDLDGDGCDEFIAGSPDYVVGTSCEVTIYSGKSGAVVDSISGPADTRFGSAVDGDFDVDGDGYSEVVIGAPFDGTNSSYSGRVVVYSPHTKQTLYDLYGPSTVAELGTAVRGLTDLDKDGFDEFIVGAPFIDTAYVYSGKTGSVMFTLTGKSLSFFGWSVAGGGNMNGDGHNDFLIGSPKRTDSSGNTVGRVSAFSGKDGTKLWSVDGPLVSWGGNGGFGTSITHAGDLDGDGLGDCVVGDPLAQNPGTGFFSGGATVISGATGTVLYSVYGGPPIDGAFFGNVVRGGGDLDGDGVYDWLANASSTLIVPPYVQAYTAAGNPIYTYEMVTTDPVPTAELYGQAFCSADVDGDGRRDLVIGNPVFDSGNGIIELRATAVASWSNYGAGWPGTSGIPTITARQRPVVGQALDLDVSNSAGVTTPAFLMIGVQKNSIPTSKGGTLLLDPILSIYLSMPAGGLTLSGNVPDDPSLYGFDAFLQALEADAGASKGISFTAGLDLHFGFN
jgi:FG-GAP repeat protein